MKRLEILQEELGESVKGVTKPVDEAPAVLDALAALLERARILSLPDPVAPPAAVPPGVLPPVGSNAPPPAPSAVLPKLNELPPPPGAAKPDYKAAVTRVIVSVVNTGDSQGEHDWQIPDELHADARKLGSELRDLLPLLAVTEARTVAVGEVAANVAIEVPAVAATASLGAQSQLDDPATGADTKAGAQRTLQRVQTLTKELQLALFGLPRKLNGLPVRAQELAARAQTLLGGAPLSPPVLEVRATPMAAVKPTPSAAPARRPQNTTASDGNSGAPWGWYAAAGASLVATGVGIGVNLQAKRQLELCEDPYGFGCSNYALLRREQDLGVAMWSAGAALTASFITLIIISESTEEPAQQEATLWCSTGLSGASCQGTY